MQDDNRPSGPLPHLGILRFAGADAVVFLQGQVSNDTRRLGTGSTLLAAYSSPQGRVVAVMRLLPHSTGVMALLPREILLPTLERLRKYVMRAKVQIEDVSDQYRVVGVYDDDGAILSATGIALPEGSDYVEHAGLGLARAGADRYWVVGRAEELDALAFTGDSSDGRVESAWRLADIREGLPQIYAATREMFVAQMLNLDVLDGISFTKGCFTGQEIIARTQHLGRIKRRLFRLRLPGGSFATGQAIRLPDGRSGRLTELAAAPEGVEALAVLSLEGGPGETSEGEGAAVAATELPLPYSLVQQA